MKKKILIFVKSITIKGLFKFINKIPLSRIIGLIILYPAIRFYVYFLLASFCRYNDTFTLKSLELLLGENSSIFFGLTILAGAYLFKKK